MSFSGWNYEASMICQGPDNSIVYDWHLLYTIHSTFNEVYNSASDWLITINKDNTEFSDTKIYRLANQRASTVRYANYNLRVN